MTDTEEALKAFDRCKGTLLNGSVQAYLIPLQYVDTIRSALQSQGWQEISSAPMDGTMILGYVRVGDQAVTQSVIWFERYFQSENGVWTRGNNREVTPTHWQPLPPPPKVMK